MSTHEIRRAGPDVNATYDRQVEIISLITPSQSDRGLIEYSALIGAAITIIAAENGVKPTPANLSRLLRMVCEVITPAIEHELGTGLWD